MSIEAEIIEDSTSPEGIRLVTMQLRYPRFIHAEFMTHRVFSRNASSSRAIPVAKMIEDLRRDPAMPVFWGSNKPGMQAGEELAGDDLETVKEKWLSGMEEAIHVAEYVMDLGLHKQIANRILEPWAHISVVVTATDWDNFFSLRCHPDAQPEMRILAEAMKAAFDGSIPRLLYPSEWHLPYVRKDEWEIGWEQLIKLSVARCARVSYLTHDMKTPVMADDIALYERLVGSRPLHASPAEHQAIPDKDGGFEGRVIWVRPDRHGNFTGWQQYRKILEEGLD